MSTRWRQRLFTSARLLRRGEVRSLVARSVAASYEALRLDRFYLRVLVFEQDLTRSIPQVATDGSLDVRQLRRAELSEYRAHRPERDPAEVQQRLDAGYLCFVAWREDRIVYEHWFVPEAIRLVTIDRYVVLAPDELWGYEAYVPPALRGQGIATAARAKTYERLKAAGYRRTFAYVGAQNRAGRGPPTKLGTKRVGSMGYVRLGPFRRDFVRTHGAAPEWMRAPVRGGSQLPS